MRSGPREQLRPIESGFTCFTAFHSASTVCAEIIVSPPRPTAAEIITGKVTPSASNTSWIATMAALALRESKMVSTSSTSEPPAMSARTCLHVRRLHLIERDHTKARVVGVGRVGERDRERPDGAGDEATLAVGGADAVRPLAALARGLLVDLPGEVVQERVAQDLLVEGGVLSSAVLARVVDEELALADAGRAEGVRLDDVGAGFEEAAVDVADHLRLREREEVAVVQQVLLRICEALAADVRLLHAVGTDRRPHRPVDDGDALSGGERRAGESLKASRINLPWCSSEGADLAFWAMRQHDLKVGLLRFAAGDLGEGDGEAGAREQALERARREARVALAVGGRDLALVVGIEA